MKISYWASMISLVLLVTLCVAWELKLAPAHRGGSLLVLKCVPLLLLWRGILHQRIRTYQLTSLLVWLYFAEGVTRAWSERGLAANLALAEVVLSLALFASVVGFSRAKK